MVFSHEKPYLLSDRPTGFPTRGYSVAVWDEAKRLAELATEIQVIGYSFATLDQAFSIDLLRRAKRCTRILIQDKEPEDVCRRIVETCPEMRHLLDPQKISF